jgi:hypothetical protein
MTVSKGAETVPAGRPQPAKSGHWNFVCIIELPYSVRNESGCFSKNDEEEFFSEAIYWTCCARLDA